MLVAIGTFGAASVVEFCFVKMTQMLRRCEFCTSARPSCGN